MYKTPDQYTNPYDAVKPLVSPAEYRKVLRQGAVALAFCYAVVIATWGSWTNDLTNAPWHTMARWYVADTTIFFTMLYITLWLMVRKKIKQ